MNPAQLLTIHGIGILLDPAEGVFMPSANGLFYANSITINPGESVIDIGTGSGVLAILAAQSGASSVTATDTDSRSVEAARHNAFLNQVEVDFYRESLFGNISTRFDVIMANLPNEIVAPAELERLDAADAKVFEGGNEGNESILALLAAAKDHMYDHSRLYLAIHTLTNYHQTLSTALQDYRLRLLSLLPLPLKPFVLENLDFYLPLNQTGTISIFQQCGMWHSYGYVYEAMLQ